MHIREYSIVQNGKHFLSMKEAAGLLRATEEDQDT